MAVHKIDIEIAGRTLSLETGRVAGLADGAVLVTYGDTVLLATAVSSTSTPMPGFVGGRIYPSTMGNGSLTKVITSGISSGSTSSWRTKLGAAKSI